MARHVERSNRALRRGIRVDGEMFRELRNAAGLTQSDLGAMSGYSSRLIRKLEGGGPVDTLTATNVYQALASTDVPPQVPFAGLVVRHHDNDNEALIRLWFDRVFNKRDLSVVESMVDDKVELLAEGKKEVGREAIRLRVSSILQAFDPLRLTVDRVVSEGNTVVAYWQVHKRHVGEFLGIPPTGRWVEIRGSSLAVFSKGRLIQARDHWDVQDLITQLTNEEMTADEMGQDV
ncbi:MAG: ester cyclase [Planctomycetales bacterium]|nr:ester cyclase [Planctomycetales bacterium]